MKYVTKKHQSGAALLVSLIMLLLLTMIGIASIEDTALQSNMARNSQFKMRAFNLSFSEGKAQYDAFVTEYDNTRRVLLLESLFGKITPYTYPDGDLVMTNIPDNKFDISATLQFVSEDGVAIAANENEAASISLLKPVIYEINAVSELQNTSTKSNQIHGLEYRAPKAE